MHGEISNHIKTMKQYCVYILTNKNNKVLYIGVTGNLKRRITEHKNKTFKGFTEKYNCDKLVYFEQTENIMSALEREKQLKKWRREKKVWLIEKNNPNWKELDNDDLF
jgi:putative endonuclease